MTMSKDAREDKMLALAEQAAPKTLRLHCLQMAAGMGSRKYGSEPVSPEAVIEDAQKLEAYVEGDTTPA